MSGKKLSAVVIGGGLSGLAAGWLLQDEAGKAGLSLQVTVLEARSETGGKIGTLRREGFACETGPNGFLDSKPATLDLVKRMGIRDLVLRSNDAARKRFIFSRGELKQLPENPVAFLKSDLISWPGKLRIAQEFLVPQKKKQGEDETLADFVRRRLGPEALEKLIDPMASGIFAGDPENMSLSACFGKVEALEERYGGLLRGMLAMKAEAKARGKQGPDSAGPGGVLFSFREGMGQLIAELTARLTVEREAEVVELQRRDQGGRVIHEAVWERGGKRQSLAADLLVLAIPAYDAARLLQGFDPGIASTMRTIPYASMAVVHLGYPASALPRPLDGFGFLIPHSEGRRILGSLWSSSIFAHRAPSGHVLLTNMMGGAQDPQMRYLSEQELTAIAREELRVTMGLDAEPEFSSVFSWEKAIPQYTFGHLGRVATIERRLSSDHPGVLLTGNAFRGIGINDCVGAGGKAAEQGVVYLKSIAG